MAGAVTPERPTIPAPTEATGSRHTRWFLVVFYALAFVWGLRSIHFWLPSRLDVLFPIASAVVLGWWAIIDARLRRHPIPLLARPWFFVAAGLVVPGYVLWSRRWPGAGWLVLNPRSGARSPPPSCTSAG